MNQGKAGSSFFSSDLYSDCKGVKASLLTEHRSQTLLNNVFILYISGDGMNIILITVLAETSKPLELLPDLSMRVTL